MKTIFRILIGLLILVVLAGCRPQTCATVQPHCTVHAYQHRLPTSFKDSFCCAHTQRHSGSYTGS
jgi:hypothetical protein